MALDELDRALALCEKHKLGVLLDIHAVKGSQNGFDNSGETMRVKWTQVSSQGPEAITTFEHWPLRAADWLGHFDEATASYGDSPTPTNMSNFNHSLRVVAVHLWHPSVVVGSTLLRLASFGRG